MTDTSRPVVLVTGAASGIGRATAELFAERGFGVVAVDQDKAGLVELSETDGVVALVGDVSGEEDNAAAVALALDTFGRLDVAVLNAGIGGTRPLEDDLALETCDRILAVNLRGPILGLRATLPALRASAGSVVVTASVAGLRGDPGNWAYNTAKGGLVNLVRAKALDYAAQGVRINAIAPGLIETTLTAKVWQDPQVEAALSRRIPLQRLGQPKEQAEAIWFLASPAASYITGTTLVVDGGLDANIGLLPLPALPQEEGHEHHDPD